MTIEAPLISIAILNYNGLKYLEQTIPYILELDYPNFEIVVVDNASIDASIDYLGSFQSPRMRIVSNSQNTGYSIGKNQCIEQSKGEYILLLDEDIKILTRDSLWRLLKLYKETDTRLLSVLLVNKGESKTTYHGGNWGLFGYSLRKKIALKDFLDDSREFHYADSPEGGAIFFSRKYLQRIGGYEISQPYYLDAGDLGLKSLSISGKKTVVTHQLYFEHLGIERKTELKSWLWKFNYIPQGTLKILFYNHGFLHAAAQAPFILVFFFLGSFQKAYVFKSVKPIFVYIKSIYAFFKEFPQTLKVRAYRKSKELENKVIFLAKSKRSIFEIIEPLKTTELNFKVIDLKKHQKISTFNLLKSFISIMYLMNVKRYKKLLIESGDWPLLYAILLKYIAPGVKVIYRMRGDIIFEINDKLKKVNSVFGKIYYRLITRSLEKVDCVIFCSEWLLNRYVAYRFKKCVVPNAIDFKRLSRMDVPGSGLEKEIDLLFITSFEFKKKIVPTIEFLRKFEARIALHDLSVAVLGDGMFYQEISSQKWVKNIQFLGRKEFAVPFYRRSSVFCHFSNLDAYPLVTLEAGYFRLAVVVNDDCGMREQVIDGYNGIVLQDLSSDDAFERILKLLKNNEDSLSMGRQGRGLVIDRHNPTVIGLQLETYIRGC